MTPGAVASAGRERSAMLGAMGIGTGIFLLVAGDVLSFGVRDSSSAIDVTAVGYVCMAVGALAIVLALVVNHQRTNTTHSACVERRDDVPPRV